MNRTSQRGISRLHQLVSRTHCRHELEAGRPEIGLGYPWVHLLYVVVTDEFSLATATEECRCDGATARERDSSLLSEMR